MEDIHELVLWNDNFIFRVNKTTVMITKISCFQYEQRLEVDEFWQKLRKNNTKSYLQLRWGISQTAKWKNSQNQIQKINIPSSFVFDLETSKCQCNVIWTPQGAKMKFTFWAFCISLQKVTSIFLSFFKHKLSNWLSKF